MPKASMAYIEQVVKTAMILQEEIRTDLEWMSQCPSEGVDTPQYKLVVRRLSTNSRNLWDFLETIR